MQIREEGQTELCGQCGNFLFPEEIERFDGWGFHIDCPVVKGEGSFKKDKKEEK